MLLNFTYLMNLSSLSSINFNIANNFSSIFSEGVVIFNFYFHTHLNNKPFSSIQL